MKTIGLIGGMSWESTVTYYQVVNQVVKEQLGGLHSAKCLLYSVDFHELEACLACEDWDRITRILSDAAQKLERGGAEFILICTNTMHKVADRVQQSVNVPLMHIAEVTAQVLQAHRIQRVALLGTKYTMEQDFYKGVLARYGLDVLVPGPEARAEMNRIIFNELCCGEIKQSAKQYYLEVIGQMAAQGAQGVILGCTEIGLLVTQEDTSVPLFDTALIHARQAALYALENKAGNS